MPADAAEIKAAVNKAAPRFMEKTVERGDCLVWTASGDGKGYGQFWFDGKLVRAHRFAWLLVHGSLPDGELDHTCSNRTCVNINHLEIVDHAENMRRTQERGRRYTATHCKHCGTEFTITAHAKQCRPCNDRKSAEWQRRKRSKTQ